MRITGAELKLPFSLKQIVVEWFWSYALVIYKDYSSYKFQSNASYPNALAYTLAR